MEKLKTPKLFWAGWGTAGAVWQWHCLRTHNGATGSETTRALLKTHTVPGKVVFISGIGVLLVWFPRHILKTIERGIDLVAGLEDDSEYGY